MYKVRPLSSFQNKNKKEFQPTYVDTPSSGGQDKIWSQLLTFYLLKLGFAKRKNEISKLSLYYSMSHKKLTSGYVTTLYLNIDKERTHIICARIFKAP